MAGALQESDYLEGERERVVLLVATASSLCFLPFVLNNLKHGRWVVSLCALAVLMTTGSNAWARFRRQEPLIDIAYMIPLVSVFLVACFHNQGMIGVFWGYPAIVCHHFMLPPRKANIAEITFLTVSVVCAYHYIDFAYFTRFTMTLLLVSAACRLFIKVISKQHTEINQLSQELRQDNQKLEELESFRREFIEDLSHGLGTPLSSIHMGLESLASGDVSQENQEAHLARLLRQIEWVGQASKRLMSLSRWEIASPQLFLKPISLSTPLFSALEAVEERMLEANIELKIDGSVGGEVLADSDALRDVFIALLENTAQHSGGHCTLTVRIEELPNAVSVVVSDDGQGMAPEDAQKATKRYYTTGGTGLGLAIVTHLIEAHQAQPIVRSAPKEGFSVRFSLPKS